MIDTRFDQLIQKATTDREYCWGIELTVSRLPNDNNDPEFLYASPSRNQLASILKCSPAILQAKHRDQISELQKIMVTHDLIMPGVPTQTLRARQRALVWWNNLEDSDKKDLSVFGNRIQMGQYIKGWKEAFTADKQEILQKIYEKFEKELIELGSLSEEYIPVKDRHTLRSTTYITQQTESTKDWNHLANLPLKSINDLASVSNSDDEYRQLKQLFAVMIKTVSSHSAKSNYKIGYTHLKQFLEAQAIPFDTPLTSILDELLLVRFKRDYVLERISQDTLSPSSAATILSAIRKALRRAKKINGIGFSSFQDAIFSSGGRTTLSHKPYTKREREEITNGITKDIAEITEFLKPYESLSIGEYPLDENGKIIKGKATLDNARFLFEEYLNEKPTFWHKATTPEEKAFLRIIQSNNVGLHKLYREWGVLPIVNQDIIAPFIFRLAQATGMNAESIVELEIDDFVLKHDATGKPCLRYWKERALGAKELHLDLFDAKIQWLTLKQSKIVEEIFSKVIELTDGIRTLAEDKISQKLFIYQSDGTRSTGEIKDFSSVRRLNRSYSRFVDKHNLVNGLGEPLRFTLTRFRPSFVSDLIEQGVSIREIQLMLGHKSLITTIGYLDRLDFNKVARDKVRKSLQEIHNKVMHDKQKPSRDEYKKNEDGLIFKTPLANCKNIFNPPDFIKNSSAYVPGQPCSQYNKCLGCENVMLTASHLPELFAMQQSYLFLLQHNRVMDTPYGVVVEENLSLLNEILSAETTDFTLDELEQGKKLSKFVDTSTIDTFGS